MADRLTALRARARWGLNAVRLISDPRSLARMLALRDWDPSTGDVSLIEGAERDVLNAETEWSEHVRSIKVEGHEPYTTDACAADLARLGFATRIDDGWNPAGAGNPPVVGVRP